MIKRFSEFLLSQHRLLKGWELPLAGLLLVAGLTATVSTLQSTATQKQTKVVASNSIAPRLDEEVPQPQEPANAPPAVGSSLEAPVPQKPDQAVKHTTLNPSLAALAPQKPDQAVEHTTLGSSLEAPVPQGQEPGVEHTTLSPSLAAPAPQLQEPVGDSTSVAPTLKAAVPQPDKQTVKSASVAKSLTKLNHQPQAVRKATIAQLPAPNRSIPDGTYVYGQSTQPQQIGKEYLVFEARQGKVVGAMYMPGSEYSCFKGTFASNQLDLTVANSYNQTAISHTIDARPAQVAAAGGEINLQNTYDSLTYPHTIRLEDYQPLNKVSDNDKQILNSCQSNSQGQVE